MEGFQDVPQFLRRLGRNGTRLFVLASARLQKRLRLVLIFFEDLLDARERTARFIRIERRRAFVLFNELSGFFLTAHCQIPLIGL